MELATGALKSREQLTDLAACRGQWVLGKSSARNEQKNGDSELHVMGR